MATRVWREMRYDAPVEDVRAMLVDPEFREAVLASQRVVRGSVSVDGDVLRLEQVQSAMHVPSFAKKLVGEEITIVQEEHWHSPTQSRIVVTIPGKPGEITGSGLLREGGGGTTHAVDLDVRVAVPLVGGRIESLVAGLLEKAFDKEHQTGLTWLAAR